MSYKMAAFVTDKKRKKSEITLFGMVCCRCYCQVFVVLFPVMSFVCVTVDKLIFSFHLSRVLFKKDSATDVPDSHIFTTSVSCLASN